MDRILTGTDSRQKINSLYVDAYSGQANEVLSAVEAKARPLEVVLKEKLLSRNALAMALGCSGPALTSAVRNGRRIHVVIHEDGRVEAFEISTFPGRT